MSDTIWTWLDTFNSHYTAHRLAEKLTNKGIPATVSQSRNTVSGYAVHVPKELYNKAHNIAKCLME